MLYSDELRIVMNALSDTVLLCGRDGVIVECSARAEALLGYRPDELAGQSVDILVQPEIREAHAGLRGAYTRLPKARPMQSLEVEAVCKDGKLLPVSIALSPVKLDDQSMIIVCIRDNSAAVEARRNEREVHERALQAQRLEGLGMLSSGIAHDFRNLLTVVLGNAELAMLEMPEPHPLREYVHSIELAANHLRHMSTQILNVASNSVGQRQVVDVPRLAEEMCALLRISLPASTRLEFSATKGLPVLFTCPGQLSQILLNLILNSRDAIGASGGCIRVRVAPDYSIDFGAVNWRGQRDGETEQYLCIEVSDDGCGIEQASIDRIFDPFFTTKPGGKGLGLSVVNGIAKSQGGYLQINSRFNVGSTFRVYLPVSPSAANAEPPAETCADCAHCPVEPPATLMKARSPASPSLR